MPPKGPKTSGKREKNSVVRFIYLYLISAITFIVFIIGAVNIVDTMLKEFVFNVNDYYFDRPMIECEYLVREPEMEEAADGESAYKRCLEKQKIAKDKEDVKSISDDAARKLSIGIAQVLIALPFWLFHWRIIERDRKRLKK